MNGYKELRDIHRLAQEAVLEFDKGEYPTRTLIAQIREIAGTFPRFGNGNEYIGFACWKHRSDNQQAYLSLCDSDAEGAFPIYRHAQNDGKIAELRAGNERLTANLSKKESECVRLGESNEERKLLIKELQARRDELKAECRRLRDENADLFKRLIEAQAKYCQREGQIAELREEARKQPPGVPGGRVRQTANGYRQSVVYTGRTNPNERVRS